MNNVQSYKLKERARNAKHASETLNIIGAAILGAAIIWILTVLILCV